MSNTQNCKSFHRKWKARLEPVPQTNPQPLLYQTDMKKMWNRSQISLRNLLLQMRCTLSSVPNLVTRITQSMKPHANCIIYSETIIETISNLMSIISIVSKTENLLFYIRDKSKPRICNKRWQEEEYLSDLWDMLHND